MQIEAMRFKILRISHNLLALFIFFALVDCNHELDSFPDKFDYSDSTLIIAHRGNGDTGPFLENTLAAAEYGLTYADGIEVDVQKSLSGTLWMYHDSYIVECDGKEKNRIPEKKDQAIDDYIACKGGFKLGRLEEVFNYHKQNRLSKLIILDVKHWLPSKNSNTTAYHIQVADKIVKLARKYEIEDFILVECENAIVLNRIKKKSKKIGLYLTTYGDLERGAYRALKSGYQGLSFMYDSNNPPAQDRIDKVRKKGLKLQFWVINSKEAIEEAKKLNPFIIQTDTHYKSK